MNASTASPEENLGVELGSVLVGKYRIDAILGQGGMGVVARATHLHMREPVAIKFLRADIAGDAEAVQRFLREATAASKLRGEHVARVLDVGTLDTGLPYLVMEHLEGVDLDGLLFQSGRIAPPLAVEFVVQACEALAEAHALGIVHRDVKPSNFFVTWRGDGSPLVKLLDFGISKAQSTTDVSLTQTQSMLGTPAYMSPEQMRSARTVDARTDIWSLGAVLFELLEGRKPFEAASFSEMCVMVAVDPPSRMTPPTPPALEAAIGTALEKRPEARYADVGQFARAIAPFARDVEGALRTAARIERQLARAGALSADASGPIAVPAPRLDTPPPRLTTPGIGAPAAARAASPYGALLPTPAAVAPTLTAAGGASPSRRWAWIALALIGVALAAVVIVGQLGSPSHHAPAAGTSTPTPAGSPPATGAVQPAPATTDRGGSTPPPTDLGANGAAPTAPGANAPAPTDTDGPATPDEDDPAPTAPGADAPPPTETAGAPPPPDDVARPAPDKKAGKKPGRRPGRTPGQTGASSGTGGSTGATKSTPTPTGGDDVYGKRK
ncbi:MAG: protein kinase [Kofleriaceae bacterium]